LSPPDVFFSGVEAVFFLGAGFLAGALATGFFTAFLAGFAIIFFSHPRIIRVRTIAEKFRNGKSKLRT
jgi:hypothetical protein